MFTTSEYLGDFKPALFNAVCGKKDAEEAAKRDPERVEEWHQRVVAWDIRAKEWAGIIIGRHC